MTGVTRAQVRRVTGSSEAPDSSQNTTAARRRRALRRILRPVLGDPAGDGLLVTPAGAPQGVPAAGVLPRDTELVGDLGLGAAGGKQLTGLHTDVFERLAVTQAAGVVAVGGWSHAAMLPGHARSCHRNERTSFS